MKKRYIEKEIEENGEILKERQINRHEERSVCLRVPGYVRERERERQRERERKNILELYKLFKRAKAIKSC